MKALDNDEDSYLIPLWRKNGDICGYTMVSPESYEKAMQHRWHKGAKQQYVGYARRPGGRKGQLVSVLLHRFLLGLPDRFDGRVGDHINGNVLDNRLSNLRIVSKSINCQNAKRRADNTSGYRGIAWSKDHKKWRCNFVKDGKRIEVGLFKDLSDAVAARDKALESAYKYYVRFE